MIIKNVTILDENGYRSDRHVIIEDDRISSICEKYPDDNGHRVIDASGMLLIPGIVNSHTHGITNSPLFSSGAPPLKNEKVIDNLNKHLSEGTTTILSGDGFTIPEEIPDHPMNIKTSTTHYPTAFESSILSDGIGITYKHHPYTIKDMLESGAIMIGEVGSGATLGGGVQDYLYIPERVFDVSMKEISEKQARALKEAVLGREIDKGRYDEKKLTELMYDFGINCTLGEIKDAIEESVLPPFAKSIKSIEDVAKLSEEYGVQVAVHHAAPSKDVVEKISYLGDRLIAIHSNHPSFEHDEALRQAEKLKKKGVLIDIGTFDSLYAGNQDEIEMFSSFVYEGLADVASTDYGGGNHDGILRRLDDIEGDVGYKISLVTNRPAELIDGLAPERGYVKKGYIADLVLVDRHNIGNVDKVIISGKVQFDKR